MPVKTLAMNRLKGHKRNFYMDEHGGYSHEYVDFYPAELVEKIIDDLSRQVLEERKKCSEIMDYCRDKRNKLRKQRHEAVAALHNLQLAFATQQCYFYEMEVELCKHDGTDPTKALKKLHFWTKVRNAIAFRELTARQRNKKCPQNTNKA